MLGSLKLAPTKPRKTMPQVPSHITPSIHISKVSVTHLSLLSLTAFTVDGNSSSATCSFLRSSQMITVVWVCVILEGREKEGGRGGGGGGEGGGGGGGGGRRG